VRVHTTRLAFGAPDPFAVYPTIHEEELEDCKMKETIARYSDNGLGGVDAESMMGVRETLKGKQPTRPPKDLTPHHLCAFTCTVLQRLVMSKNTPPALATETLTRVMELLADSRGLWAGGEFIGMCLNVAAGIGKFGIACAPDRTRVFLRLPGGISTLAHEICASADNTGVLQQALQDLTPADWAQAQATDISGLLLQYVFASMDGEVASLSNEDAFMPYVTAILGNLLSGFPDLVSFLTGDNQTSQLRLGLLQEKAAPRESQGCLTADEGLSSEVLHMRCAFLPLFRDVSSFGAYVFRQFGKRFNKLKSKGGAPPDTREVTRQLVRAWRCLKSEDKVFIYIYRDV